MATVAACGRIGFDETTSSPPSRATEALLDTFSTTSMTYVDVPISLTFTPSDANERWVLLISGQLWGEVSTNSAVEARYFINGLERGMGGGIGRLGAASSWQHFDLIADASGSQTVTVQLRDVEGPRAGVDNLRLVAFPLPADADPQFSEITGDVSPIGNFSAYHTLDLAPREPGDYLVLALVVGTEDPSPGVLGIRVRDPAGLFWPSDRAYSNDRPVWHSYLVARTSTVTSRGTYAIELNANDLVPATVRNLRMLAFRTDAFTSFETAADLGSLTTTDALPVVKSRLVTASSAAEHTSVILQGMQVFTDLATETERGLQFRIGEGVVHAYTYSVDNSVQRLSFGTVDLVTTTAEGTYENAFYSPSGQQIIAAESVIHVLGLD